MTLTFVENLTDREEAQRRFNNLARRVLRDHLTDWMTVPERQSRGALHYHSAVAFPYDVRTGFDFETCTAANLARKRENLVEFRRLQQIAFRSANSALRAWWSLLREKAPRYGFGRCETLPVLSNAEGVARYVGSYVSSEFVNRRPEDKGLRTVRYSLRERVASCQWAWAKGAGGTWRRGCQAFSLMLAMDELQIRQQFGKTWRFKFRQDIGALGRHFESALTTLPEFGPLNPADRIDRLRALAEAIRRWEVARSFVVEKGGEA